MDTQAVHRRKPDWEEDRAGGVCEVDCSFLPSACLSFFLSLRRQRTSNVNPIRITLQIATEEELDTTENDVEEKSQKQED